jgi:hypothetical protein
VDGVYLPFALESYEKGSTDHQKVQIEKAQANIAPDKGLFGFPAARTTPAPAK